MSNFWEMWEPKDLLQAISGFAIDMFWVSIVLVSVYNCSSSIISIIFRFCLGSSLGERGYVLSSFLLRPEPTWE